MFKKQKRITTTVLSFRRPPKGTRPGKLVSRLTKDQTEKEFQKRER